MGNHRAQAAGACMLAIAACATEPDVSTDEQFTVACAGGPTIRGIDVSVYEDSVDWTAVHAAGIDFAFIRVTDGTQYLDPKFPAYWAGAKAAGVIRGTYQFFRPAEDPIAQAELLLDRMGSLDPGDLPPVLDVETDGGLSEPQVATAVRAWVAHVTEAIGRPPIVYAGLYSWPALTGSANLTASPLWIAQYTSAVCPDIPAPWTSWMFWQTSSTGQVAGIPGAALDLDVWNGTLDDLRAFTAAPACGDGTCSASETPEVCPADCAPCGTIGADGGAIDDGDACFVSGGDPQFLRRVTGAGEAGDLIWTHATASALESNFALWNLSFAEAGRYRVEAYTAHAYAQSTQASYLVEAAGPPVTVAIDQTAVDGWQSLGAFEFAAGGGQSIQLGDNTGESPADDVQLVFDAIRLTRLGDAGPDPGAPSKPSPGAPADPPPGAPADPGVPPAPAPSVTITAGCAATRPGSGAAVVLAAALLVVRRSRRDRPTG